MRVGAMLRPERAKDVDTVVTMKAFAEVAEAVGLNSLWVPQIPGAFDAMTGAVLAGLSTTRIELGTAVLPIQVRHPIALAQEVLSAQAISHGRFTLGLGLSHPEIIEGMLGVPYANPVGTMRCYLDVLDQALSRSGRVQVVNDLFRINYLLDITNIAPTGVLLGALGPRMLRLAGERAEGTILWMADSRAISLHIAPRINEAAEQAGRSRPRIVAGLPICECASSELDVALERTRLLLGAAESFPSYERVLAMGDARSVADLLLAGDEAEIGKRLQVLADAGATDFLGWIVPIGRDRQARELSVQRTMACLGALNSREAP